MSDMHPHLARLLAALGTEERWERDEHARMLQLDLHERVAVGVSLGPLSVEEVRAAARGRSIALLRAPRGTTVHDGISVGDPVVLGPLATPDDGVTGVVVYADLRAVEVLVDGPCDITGAVVLTRRLDPTTYHRYRAALRAANDLKCPLRELLLGERKPGEPSKHGIPDLSGSRLNDGQRFAARTALAAAELALIHGPPGTGKTEVIVAMLRAMVDDGDRPWALADSNAAVDNLAVRASRGGLDVVRIGHPLRIGEDATALSLDSRIENGPAGALLRDLDREIIRARGDHATWRQLLIERDRAWENARTAVLAAAQVFACTLGTLARVAPELPRPRTAVVDEATQAIEPAIWTVIPYAERLILVGDPHQLGPVIMEPGNPLGRSLIERLLHDDVGVPMPMLTVQHRMHTAIQDLVQPVYGGKLVAHPSVAGHRLCDLPGVRSTDLTSRATLWIDTAGAGFDDARDPVTQSTFNAGEVRIVAIVVKSLRDAGVPADAIGVIAPYAAQVARLSARPELAGVEIATVNAFQGREKEAIVCSFVRCNADGDLGFVRDRRRLTVALSRARRLLVCVGDSTTLGVDHGFAATIDAMQAAGALATVWEPPWDAASDGGT